MINTILYILCGFLRCRIIDVNDKPYLERYFITDKIFIHRFLSSDGDRHLHNHPWHWALSIILCGWYREDTERAPYVLRKWWNVIRNDKLHRICYTRRNTWTLFITSKRHSNGWGFMDSKGRYTAMPSQPGVETHKGYPLGFDCIRRPRDVL